MLNARNEKWFEFFLAFDVQKNWTCYIQHNNLCSIVRKYKVKNKKNRNNKNSVVENITPTTKKASI